MTYLNFKDISKQPFIYRIATVERFVNNVSRNDNVLVRPHKWDDPFEGHILNAYGVLPDGGQVAFRLRRNFFGQCWSLHRETDLMWRAYSPNADSVKLRVRADKLHDSLKRYQAGSDSGLCFLGRVSYEGKKKFQATLQRGCHFGDPGAPQAETLLIKRYGFRSEQEVRLIAYAEYESEPDLIRYPVDWNDLVMEVVLDPRMGDAKVARAKEDIRAAGYVGNVIQSGLYKKPPPLSFSVDLTGTPRPAR